MAYRNRERADTLGSRIREAIHATGMRVSPQLEEKIIHRVRNVFDKDEELSAVAQPSPIVLRNLVVLMEWFDFTAADVRPLVKKAMHDTAKLSRKLNLKQAWVGIKAQSYGRAAGRFDRLRELLLSGTPLENMDLVQQLEMAAPRQEEGLREQSEPALRLVRFIEDLQASDDFQEGSPDAICKVVEHYIEIGALSIAQGLLAQALEEAVDHAGLWFQRARLFLALAEQETKSAFHYQLMKQEAEAMSSEEAHYEDLADEHAGRAGNFRSQVFGACVEALHRLPESGHQASVLRWITDYRSYCDLRRQVLVMVVREAGLRTNPYCPFGGVQDRVLARLNRLKTFGPGGFVHDPERNERLRAEPLFSAQQDAILIAAYDELMSDYLVHTDQRMGLRMLGLNYVRLLASDRYVEEVAGFVDQLSHLTPHDACQFFGPFNGLSDGSETHWRSLLHEHLDAIMDRSAQRQLVRKLYQRWVDWASRQQADAERSICIDEVRTLFAAGRWAAAYQAACLAENDGLFQRTDAECAFVLWRSALAAAKSAYEAGDEHEVASITARHLADQRLVELAERFYWELDSDEDGFPVGTPLDGEGLDEFAAVASKS